MSYLNNCFDEIVILAFGKKTNETQKIVEQYNLNCHFISIRKLRLKTILNFFKWFRCPYVKEELSRCFKGRKTILKIIYLCYYGLYYVLTEPFLIREVKNSESDIYVYSFWLSRSAFCVANIKEHYKGKILYTCSRAHRYDLYHECNKAGYLPFRLYIASNLDAIYFISEDGMKYFARDVKKFANIKNECALKISYLGTKNQFNIKKTIQSKKNIMIASCSNIINVKRLDLIVDVICFLQEKGLNIRWIHIGDGSLFKEVRVRAQNNLKQNSFLFLGKKDNSQILQIYEKFDVDYFINLSDSEGIPVSIMEAMSAGIPVIARGVGGNNEIVDCNCGCLISESLSSYDMFKEIYQFVLLRIVSIEQYVQLSHNAKMKWENRYSADNNYSQFCLKLLSCDARPDDGRSEYDER